MVIENNTVMSPSDLCTMEFLDKIAASGVSIFKIEGRARAADYVAVVTRSYRQALDKIANNDWQKEEAKSLVEEMRTVYNRTFWQGGYYQGKTIDEWSNSENTRATKKRHHLGIVTNYFVKPSIAEIVLQGCDFTLGDELLFEGPTTGSHPFTPEEIWHNDVRAEEVHKGDVITIKVDTRVRRKDNVYLLEHLEPEES
jgi:putative protease